MNSKILGYLQLATLPSVFVFKYMCRIRGQWLSRANKLSLSGVPETYTAGWDMMQIQKFSWKGDIKGEHRPTVWLMQLMIQHQRHSAAQRQTQENSFFFILFYFLCQTIPTNTIIKLLCLFPYILMQHLHWHAYFRWDGRTQALIKEWLYVSVYGDTPDAFNFFPLPQGLN